MNDISKYLYEAFVALTSAPSINLSAELPWHAGQTGIPMIPGFLSFDQRDPMMYNTSWSSDLLVLIWNESKNQQQNWTLSI